MWINTETKQTYVMHTDIRLAAGNVSLPRELTDEVIASIGLLPVTVVPAPEHDPSTEQAVQGECVYNEQEQRWETTWTVRALTAEEVQAREAEITANNVARAKAELQDSDWADLPSVRNTDNTPHLVNGADFDTYRLALRAIVVSTPVEVSSWPTRPTAVWA